MQFVEWTKSLTHGSMGKEGNDKCEFYVQSLKFMVYKVLAASWRINQIKAKNWWGKKSSYFPLTQARQDLMANSTCQPDYRARRGWKVESEATLINSSTLQFSHSSSQTKVPHDFLFSCSFFFSRTDPVCLQLWVRNLKWQCHTMLKLNGYTNYPLQTTKPNLNSSLQANLRKCFHLTISKNSLMSWCNY